MEVIIPIGISGSGKSTLYKKRYSHLTHLSPELIAKELYGNIKINFFIFNDIIKETDRRIQDFIEKGESFYYDGYTIDTYRRKNISDMFRGKDIKVTYIVLPSDIEVSRKRIEEDLKNNVERANVSDITLKIQLQLYKKSLENNFEDENVQEIIYLKEEDLK